MECRLIVKRIDEEGIPYNVYDIDSKIAISLLRTIGIEDIKIETYMDGKIYYNFLLKDNKLEVLLLKEKNANN